MEIGIQTVIFSSPGLFSMFVVDRSPLGLNRVAYFPQAIMARRFAFAMQSMCSSLLALSYALLSGAFYSLSHLECTEINFHFQFMQCIVLLLYTTIR